MQEETNFKLELKLKLIFKVSFTSQAMQHDRKTNETFFIEGKVTFEWIFEIQVSEALPSFRIFYYFV